MSNKLTKESFFVITKDNFREAKSRLYGYAITENKIFHNYTPESKETLEIGDHTSGPYIYVSVDDEYIKIAQDYIGSFGIYLFKDGDYWALSNSLYLLLENLPESRKVSLNLPYAAHFYIESFAPFVVDETICKEIKLLRSNEDILINMKTGGLTITDKAKKCYRSVYLDTPEGLSIIDKWIEKYTTLIQFLIENNHPLSIDVSGGFDSRVTLALLVAQKFDLSNVRFFSNAAEKIYKDDYLTAKLLADAFNFSLNKKNDISDQHFLKMDDAYEIFKYLHLSAHKSISLPNTYSSNPVFLIGGQGGEAQRGAWPMTPDEYLQKFHYGKNDTFLVDQSALAFVRTVKKVSDEGFEQDIMQQLYTFGRGRYHFGKHIARSALLGNVRLAPLFDPLLFSIDPSCGGKVNPITIYAVIMLRCNPTLLDIPFEKNRKIPEDAIIAAKKIIRLLDSPKRSNKKTYQYIRTETNIEYSIQKNSVQDKIHDILQTPNLNHLASSVFGTKIWGGINTAGNDSALRSDGYGKSNHLAILATAYVAHQEFAKIQLFSEYKNNDDSFNLKSITALSADYGFHSRHREPEQIILTAEKVCSIAPTMVSPRIRLAKLYRLKGDTKKALDVLENVTIQHPKSAPAYTAIADTYVYMKKWAKSVQIFYISLSFNATDAYTRVRLCNVLQQLGEIEEAMKVINEGLLIYPNLKNFLIKADTLKKLSAN